MGEIVRKFAAQYINKYDPPYRIKTILEHIANCRTAALGGHKTTCTACDYTTYNYNSCGDRNCPQCQTIKKQIWVEKMNHHLLPIKHFHVIFTLPHELNDLIFYNQKQMYNLFFQVVWKTIQTVTKNNTTGAVAVLHTWGSNMSYHPHIHCIIPAGSWDKKHWINHTGQGSRFYCKIERLTKIYRDLFIKMTTQFIENETIFYPTENQELELKKNRKRL